ncbi:MAG: translation elongation factor Ts [Deltaproteobacteria bacterium RBG_13_58_19]|nr:MAG: translation elongation factor Ts [Deltaproteobacteria bacterium RBG_13_58_19]
MAISAELVKVLRDKTNCGFMDCKKALQETGGDVEQAVAYLRQKGIAVAHKRGERATSEGTVWAFIMPDSGTGVLLEVNCESDFVAKTEAFQDFGARLAEQIAATGPGSVEELLTQPWQPQPRLTVADYLNEIIGQLGENIRLRRFTRYAGGGLVAAYIHHGGRIGVLLEVAGAKDAPELPALAKDLAMQVAAANPLAVGREDLDPGLVAQETAIYQAQAQESGKPEKIIERMVSGRLDKFYKEVCLLEQPFVKNPDLTVAQLLKEAGAKSGGELSVKRFVRCQVGTD